MKLCTIALDFDGTIARNDGQLDASVREAIAEVRSLGITIIIVTGRILEDLRRVAGELHFADAVVAENGAVISFPSSGYTRAAGPPADPLLQEELRRENIPFDAGHTVIETQADFAPRLLTILRRLELPLALAFNRGRVMALPQAMSKATGLREALTILRLSPHNTIAIGDAENDHALLEACELGVAVGWGSDRLKARADFVLKGDGPRAVADYIRSVARERQIPHPLKTRRRLLLGHADNGSPVELAVRGRNVLVAGDPKTGKSWVTGLLCEQLILYGYCLCVIDPEGDYASLEALPGVAVFGGAEPLPRPRDLLRALRHADVSVVIDLSHSSQREKLDYLRGALPALSILRRRTGLPHRIVVDEAHYFLHDRTIADLLDFESGGYTFVTYRASQLRCDLLASTQAVIVSRESDPEEVGALRSLCRQCQDSRSDAEWRQVLESLVLGEAVALPLTEEAEGEIRRITLSPRLTPHVRHLAKYIDLPVQEGRAFVFWRDGVIAGPRARTMRDFVATVEHWSSAALDGHLRRSDFSQWIAEVFGDYPLAKSVRRIEEAYRAQSLSDPGPSLAQAVRARYELFDPGSARAKPAVESH